jgi:hypothetical protein
MVLNDVFFRGGIDPFEVSLISTNPSIGRLTSPVGFLGGFRDNTMQFRADANGSTDISVTPLAGFIHGGPLLTRHVEVSVSRLALNDVNLGKDMEFFVQVSLLGFTGTSPASVILTSSDPGSVLISATPTDVGAASAVVSSSNGFAYFYVQALAGQGDITLTATAAGFD